MSVSEIALRHFEHLHAQALFIQKMMSCAVLPGWEFDDPHICHKEYQGIVNF